MSLWEYLGSRHEQLLADTYQQASLVFQCMVAATLVGVAVAVLAHRSDLVARPAIAAAVTVLTIPSYALLGLLIPILGLGVPPSVAAVVLYALLPIIRNGVVGLRSVDPDLVDAARGIGMGGAARLARVELPIAWPTILTGIRVATQMSMGIAAVAAFASGPGLGNEIFSGLSGLGSANALNEVLAGTLGVVVLALLFDAALVLLGRLTTSRGLRV